MAVSERSPPDLKDGGLRFLWTPADERHGSKARGRQSASREAI